MKNLNNGYNEKNKAKLDSIYTKINSDFNKRNEKEVKKHLAESYYYNYKDSNFLSEEQYNELAGILSKKSKVFNAIKEIAENRRKEDAQDKLDFIEMEDDDNLLR